MEDLLSGKIYVDDDSKKLIHSNYRLYSIMAVFITLTSLMTLIIYTFRYFRHAGQDYRNWINIFNFQLFPFIEITTVVLGILQFFYYYKAVQLQHQAADASDPLLFNDSFRYYLKGTRLGLSVIVIHFLIDLIFFYAETIAK